MSRKQISLSIQKQIGLKVHWINNRVHEISEVSHQVHHEISEVSHQVHQYTPGP